MVFLQICRVEDIDVAGHIEGTVIHFHRARSIVVHHQGVISASGLGKRLFYLLCRLFKYLHESFDIYW